MRRPLYMLIAFGLCLAVLVGALLWASVAVVRLDRAEREARAHAAIEEDVRLALWRMDSRMAAFIALESARPWAHYSAFYPADTAYSNAFRPYRQGEVLVASPLLSQSSTMVLVYFQVAPDGAITSPQIPASGVRPATAKSAIPAPAATQPAEGRLAALRNVIRNDSFAALDGTNTIAVAAGGVLLTGSTETQLAMNARRPTAVNSQPFEQMQQRSNRRAETRQQAETQQPLQQQALSAEELNARQANVEVVQNLSNFLAPVVDVRNLSGGAMRAFWVGDKLILARRISDEGRNYVQGCWLDWPAVREWLLSDVRDLFAGVDLVPSASGAAATSRTLASLPVELAVRDGLPVTGDFSSSVGYSLVVAWTAVTVAVAAAAALLAGSLALSSRRAAFVSAVTHELRTPLTTFRLYAEMLSGGMVPEEKRPDHLRTLHSEAERLSHLVENVLAYARLENRKSPALEDVNVADFLRGALPRLEARAAEAGMSVVFDSNCPDGLVVRTDRPALERIIFNLVDNASKYAASATDSRIHLAVRCDDGSFLATVSDHGPGVAPDSVDRIFSPFSKSAHDAANSAPGVGLGLHLSRRLAKSLGGDLALDTRSTTGARFTVSLPLNTQ